MTPVSGSAAVGHLLPPNQRPVLATSDLAGFWERHYPQIRKELMRRYPRHQWPEKPSLTPVSGSAAVWHLLPPNQRPVLATSDLADFSERYHPQIRKELMR